MKDEHKTPPQTKPRTESELSTSHDSAILERIWVNKRERGKFLGGFYELRLDWSNARHHGLKIELGVDKKELARNLREIADYIETEPFL